MTNKGRPLSGRKLILDVIGRHQQGLNTTKIRQLVLNDTALNAQHVGNTVTQLAKEGRINRGGTRQCPVCACESVFYTINPLYRPEGGCNA